MKKKKVAVPKNANSKKREENPLSIVSEPHVPMIKSIKVIPSLKEFTYSEFKKIADKAPFTQAEWAAMLHVSERTLQRYAKGNGSFASINAERAIQIDKVLKEGKITFGSVEKFYNWIKREPYMLEGNLSLESLTTYDGIEKVLTQLHRIQHGLFA